MYPKYYDGLAGLQTARIYTGIFSIHALLDGEFIAKLNLTHNACPTQVFSIGISGAF
jgi:hypothetical protein